MWLLCTLLLSTVTSIHWSFTVSMVLPFFRMSHNWNHSIYLFRLASFI
jgi:hypothetical protein